MDIRQAIQDKYGEAARQAALATSTSCCHASGCGPITAGLYSADERAAVPDTAVAASLGCGNPTALVDLQPGQTVLDLGSGGGIDVFLSARRVGETGKVYGLDMTAEMLALARENQQKAGVTNVEFLEGTIEAIPLPDASVDVVISNCVINLSTDKDAVLRETFRVLKAGGRFAVSDVIVRGAVSDEVRRSVEAWIGCIAGALGEQEYAAKLRAAGFTDVDVEVWRTYDHVEAPGTFASAFIRATKPANAACCGPACCSSGAL